MHLTLTNLAHHGGDRATALAAQLREQAGFAEPARERAFDTLLARAKASAAERKRN